MTPIADAMRGGVGDRFTVRGRITFRNRMGKVSVFRLIPENVEVGEMTPAPDGTPYIYVYVRPQTEADMQAMRSAQLFDVIEATGQIQFHRAWGQQLETTEFTTLSRSLVS